MRSHGPQGNEQSWTTLVMHGPDRTAMHGHGHAGHAWSSIGLVCVVPPYRARSYTDLPRVAGPGMVAPDKEEESRSGSELAVWSRAAVGCVAPGHMCLLVYLYASAELTGTNT